jgi:hypothetical protein
MKLHLTSLLFPAALALSFATAAAQPTGQIERIGASFMLAFGRSPSAAEVGHWAGQGEFSVSALVARHRQQLQGDAAMARATAVRAFQDAFGRAPGAEESASWSGDAITYTELVRRHLQWLAAHPADYAQVLGRAYQQVIRRDVYAEETDYWKTQDTLSYTLLVGCIEDWARRNQPGLMVTSGTATISVNSSFLSTLRLSPAVAAEARAAAGMVPVSEAERVANPGRNVIAAGADKVFSSGHIHFVAAGKE